MHKFKVTCIREIDADSAEEAALLMYQELATQSAPTSYSVTDEANVTVDIVLDQTKAEEFAASDHTADPGNW